MVLMLKGQTDILSAIIIIIIAIGLVGTAYTWGIPLIQKQQDTSLVERVEGYFRWDNENSIEKKIVSVATNGGEASFSEDVSGLWELVPNSSISVDNNSLSFNFFARVSNIAPLPKDQWVSLNGVPCPAVSGFIGDDAYALCARADSVPNGFNIMYKVQFRPLQSSSQWYEIVLLQHPSGLLNSTSKMLRIQRGDSYTTTAPTGQNLIITEVKILLG
jgi:hypothetical protein